MMKNLAALGVHTAWGLQLIGRSVLKKGGF